MIDLILLVLFGFIVIAGVVSIIWSIKGIHGMSDPLIRRLFQYEMAVMISLVALSILIAGAVYAYSQGGEVSVLGDPTMTYILLLAIFGLVSGTALAVKKLSDEYAFSVK